MKPQTTQKQLRLARSNDPGRPVLNKAIPDGSHYDYHTDGAILVRWPSSGRVTSAPDRRMPACSDFVWLARRDAEYHNAKEYPLPALGVILASEHPSNLKNSGAKSARYRSEGVCLMPDGTLEAPSSRAMPPGALVPMRPYYLAILSRLGFATLRVWSPIEPVVSEHPTVPGAVAVVMPCRL